MTLEIYRQDKGMALPAALMLVLFMIGTGAIFSSISISGLKQIKRFEATQQNFHASEGAVHDVLSQMATNPESWREANPLADLPNGYTEYTPTTYTSSNGIPPCSGAACHREMFPTGGGVIKNAGPMAADGGDVISGRSITEQVDTQNLPIADVTLNSQPAWSQVERLDEVTISQGSVGGSLETGNNGSSGANAVRFRVTGTSMNSLKGREATSTVVYVVEVPGT